MKKAIQGFRYDTEKAIVVCDVSNGLSNRDFSFIKAKLYKTKRSGRYFIAGVGGAMTSFAHVCSDGSRIGGEKIIPISEKSAELLIKQLEAGSTKLPDIDGDFEHFIL